VVPVTLVGWLLVANREHLTFIGDSASGAGSRARFRVSRSHRIQLKSTVSGLGLGRYRGLDPSSCAELPASRTALSSTCRSSTSAAKGFVRSPSLTAEAELILGEAVAEAHATRSWQSVDA
jgi:hypothetical protein